MNVYCGDFQNFATPPPKSRPRFAVTCPGKT